MENTGSPSTPRVRLKNTVRLELADDEELRVKVDLKFLVEKILMGELGIYPQQIFCLQEFLKTRIYDITLASEALCYQIWEIYKKKRNLPCFFGIKMEMLYTREVRALTVHMFNPFVQENEIRTFLLRYCDQVQNGEKIKNEYDIWNGKRKYMVTFKKDPEGIGGVRHPPGNFSIGPNKGYLFYPGQPRYCRKCGQFGHVMADCMEDHCSNCNRSGHTAKDCTQAKSCNLCGDPGHMYRSCPKKRRTYAEATVAGPPPTEEQEAEEQPETVEKGAEENETSMQDQESGEGPSKSLKEVSKEEYVKLMGLDVSDITDSEGESLAESSSVKRWGEDEHEMEEAIKNSEGMEWMEARKKRKASGEEKEEEPKEKKGLKGVVTTISTHNRFDPLVSSMKELQEGEDYSECDASTSREEGYLSPGGVETFAHTTGMLLGAEGNKEQCEETGE